MRIGFDITPLVSPQTGIGTYTVNLMDHLGRQPDAEVVPLAHFPTGSRRVPRLNKTLWMQFVLPWQLARLGTDVCHFTNSVAPCLTPCPSIVTIHDATLWLYPEHHPRRRLLAMRPLIPLAARRARAVIAVSCSAKRDIVRMLRIPEDKVHVVYEAPAPRFHPLTDAAYLEGVRAQYGLPERFLLHVGTIEPRKNLIRLVEAYARLRREAPVDALVLAGCRGWKDSAFFQALDRLGLARDVRILGYVPSDELVALYNLASAVVFPSLHEGFGLPIVEAMACGTPVVACPAGAAVELVDEGVTGYLRESIDGLVAAIGEIGRCSPTACRQRVSENFSADAMVDGYERIYEAVIGSDL
jgi:glycosyltransferase involved in cell wall biosynthesis